MIGSNVPHLFRNDREYYADKLEDEAVDLVVIKFEADFLGAAFLDLAEAKKLHSLFQVANKGIKFSKAATYLVHNHILGLVGSQGLSSIIGLLKILDILSISEKYKTLCLEAITNTFNQNEKDWMARIDSYLNENF